MLKTVLAVLWLSWVACPPVLAGNGPRPDILLVTVDTLRADRLSSAGYERPTSPEMDALLASGLNFIRARTPEPLTGPALSSILTSQHPHEHGATRNGIRIRPGLESLPKQLESVGYDTAAFVGSWVLRDSLSGLAEHFGHYEEVLTRKRWFGLVRRESTAEDLNERSLAWLREQDRREPVFLWVHYVEPHAPYRLQRDYTERLGLRSSGLGKADRYDTEIAYVDAAIGRLLRAVEKRQRSRGWMVILTSDHGESLGEHHYWGHGRILYETNLHVPLGISWPGHLQPSVLSAPASLLDVAPTVLGILGLRPLPSTRGLDWSPVLEGAPEPWGRATLHQAHKGAVQRKEQLDRKRRRGLLALARIDGERKEIVRIRERSREVYDLEEDRQEMRNLVARASEPSQDLQAWRDLVEAGLRSADELPGAEISEEDEQRLRSLGYLE